MTPFASLSQTQRLGIALLLLFIVMVPKQTDTLLGQVLQSLLTVGAMVGFMLILPRLEGQPVLRWARALMWVAVACSLWFSVHGIYLRWQIDQLHQLTP
jgi:O-antigen/teichoic acid export membrane protein